MGKEKFKVYEGVFDEKTLQVLEFLRRKGYYDELGRPIKTGKEGDVYLAKKDDEFRAIKIYRVTSANFKKISEYLVRDYRFRTVSGNMRKSILMWVQKEFRNLLLCHRAHINVPFAYKQADNVIVMEYLSANMLKDVNLENPESFFDELLNQIAMLKKSARLVHGDLSEFNILVKDELPFLIDFGQGMGFKNEDDFKNFEDLYLRDIGNIVRYFKKRYGFEITLESVLKQIEERQKQL